MRNSGAWTRWLFVCSLALGGATACGDDAAGGGDSGQSDAVEDSGGDGGDASSDVGGSDAALDSDAGDDSVDAGGDGSEPDGGDAGQSADVPDAADPDGLGSDADAGGDVPDTLDDVNVDAEADADSETDADASEEPDVTEWDPLTVPLRGACASDIRLGGFVVEALDGFSIVDGKVSDGVNPIASLEDVGGNDVCRLLKKEFPNCDPPCQPGFTCAKTQECVPFPKQQNLGTVTIEGLADEVVMQPKGPSNSYFDTTVPHPVFGDGGVIHLSSTDGWAGEMELFGLGSPPLVLQSSAWTIQQDTALTVTWVPPAGDEPRTELHLRLNIDQHGLSPVVADCLFEDTGSGTIPSDIINTLIEFGISGFPNARVARRTSDRIDVNGGCVDFIVATPLEPSVTISGHYPCKTDFDCPDDLVCNQPIETCE